jgi:hypothetical protein
MQVEEIAAEPAETALPVFDKSFWQHSYIALAAEAAVSPAHRSVEDQGGPEGLGATIKHGPTLLEIATHAHAGPFSSR